MFGGPGGVVAMNIRRALPADRDVLVDIWLRSVRATHTFLSEDNIQSFLPVVRDVALAELEVWVLCSPDGAVMGFMGMAGSKMEALFLAPEFHRRGGGRRLVRHAQELKGELTVDVNEQNPAARRFYEACGFVVEGRSELDSTGRPFPLLHMRLVAPPRAPQQPAARRPIEKEEKQQTAAVRKPPLFPADGQR
jgi:putative acetyltransferase